MTKAKAVFDGNDYGHKKKALVLGTTREGIDILKPRGNPTSFTWQELRAAMAAIRHRDAV